MHKINQTKGSTLNFIYGFHTVTTTIKFQPERCKKLYIARKEDSAFIKKLAQQFGIPAETVERDFLEKKFRVSSDAQGLVLECAPFLYADVDELIDQAKALVILDSWQDAVNLGRAARAGLCFGMDGLVICKDRSVQVNALAEKAAVGALARIPVARVVNLSALQTKLKKAGFFIYGADEEGEIALKDCDFANKSALVIGQEGAGLRALTKKSCDVLVRIPMAVSDICLNAADAALLMMYESHNK
jgi:23S rRNA (guanosine2251-2'-O)-methyltransferase